MLFSYSIQPKIILSISRLATRPRLSTCILVLTYIPTNSPEDQKILEDEFARNPKPDKASRLEIIKKVALGEKEIQVRDVPRLGFFFRTNVSTLQIWFQNRRQASRRRQEPAGDSDEITGHQGSRSRASSQLIPSSSMQAPASTPPAEGSEVENEEGGAEVTEEKGLELKDGEQTGTDNREEAPAKIVLEFDSQGTAYTASMASTFPAEPSSSQTIPSSQDTTRSIILKPGYLANRRSASYIHTNQDFVAVAAPNPIPTPPMVPRTFGRSTSSYLRLSTTEDGQARVKDCTVPSPPRARPLAPSNAAKSGSLRRSYSAAGLSDLFRSSSSDPDRSKFPRVSQNGRSRDSRNWNFWCDADARNSLTETADIEIAAKNGSAASAINLIRQNSRGVLRPNPRKGNTPMMSQQGSFSPNKKPRPALQRASTTHGRIQQPGKKGGEVDVWEQANTDSDKENWEPEDGRAESQASRRHARPYAFNARAGRQILGENTQVLSQSGSLGAMMNREKKGKPEIDAEVEAFMGSAQDATGGKAIGDELDCVASLLSLSKGNWK
jgi:hypothetical protein